MIRSWRSGRYVVFCATAALMATPMLGASSMPVVGSSATCHNVVAIWARGSGQIVGESKEFGRFAGQLEFYLSPDTLHVYELGSEEIEGYRYPAVAVGLEHPVVSGGAALSGGVAFKYGESVSEGVGELELYIGRTLEACPDTRFVLGGYSQGAQVVGDTYTYGLPSDVRSHVVFAMLFGDPKLYLPEGRRNMVWDESDWCRGFADRSEWRRDVPNEKPKCGLHSGSLGPRDPYLPESWTSNTGLWCADYDFVCGTSSSPWTTSGHMRYAEESGAIDEGVYEALGRLTSLPDKVDEPDRLTPKGGSGGLDVVFLIDSTGSMQEDIDEAKQIAATLSQFISSVNGRVALVEYRDADDEFTARVLSELSEDTSDFFAQLSNISVDGGGDDPEALLYALKTGMQGLDWRAGATKAAIVLTDAGYHDPDKTDGTTTADVAALSMSIDPVNVYPVVPSSGADYYAELAEATTGQVVANDENTAVALTDALARIESRPVAQLPLDAYYAASGQEVRFDGSASYSSTSEIVKWDWDFDGDGVYEVVDGTSSASHTYTESFEGFMQLRVTDAYGLVANASAAVNIDYSEPSIAPADSLEVVGNGTTATLTWTAAEDPSLGWLVTVDGMLVGAIEPMARNIDITDLDRSGIIEFGVAPATDDERVGEARLAHLEPEATPTPTSAPTKPTASSAFPIGIAIAVGAGVVAVALVILVIWALRRSRESEGEQPDEDAEFSQEVESEEVPESEMREEDDAPPSEGTEPSQVDDKLFDEEDESQDQSEPSSETDELQSQDGELSQDESESQPQETIVQLPEDDSTREGTGEPLEGSAPQKEDD